MARRAIPSSAGASLPCSSGVDLERALQRGGDRIVDRADQAGDVARRRRLAPPLGQRAARLALEIDDEDVVLDDQHLAEMEVAVVADLQAVDFAGSSALDAIGQSLRAASATASTSGAIGFAHRAAALLQGVEDALGARAGLVDPALDVARRRSAPGAKSANVVAARQRDLHLGDAPADLRHVAQIGSLLVVSPGCALGRQQALLLDEAVEIGRWSPSRRRPGSRRRRGRRRARCVVLAFDQFDAAEQRRRVGEAGDLGQEAADLDLRIDAGLELAIDLDDIVVVDERRRVGLFGLDRATYRDRRLERLSRSARSA